LSREPQRGFRAGCVDGTVCGDQARFASASRSSNNACLDRYCASDSPSRRTTIIFRSTMPGAARTWGGCVAPGVSRRTLRPLIFMARRIGSLPSQRKSFQRIMFAMRAAGSMQPCRFRHLSGMRPAPIHHSASNSRGPISYALVYQTCLLIQPLHGQKRPHLRDDNHNVLIGRAGETNATDFGSPGPRAKQASIVEARY